LTLSVFESESGQKYENKYDISVMRPYGICFHPWLQPSSSHDTPPMLRELPSPLHCGRTQAVESRPAVEHAGPPLPCSAVVEHAGHLQHEHASVGVPCEAPHARAGVAVPELGADGGLVPGSMTRSRSQLS
jgi:hypothetical protein